MARKKQGKSYTLYLPEHLMQRANLVADERGRSTSFIVAQALKSYLRPPSSDTDNRDQGNDVSIN